MGHDLAKNIDICSVQSLFFFFKIEKYFQSKSMIIIFELSYGLSWSL